MKYAGGDATEAYDEIHAPGILEGTLSKEQFMGVADNNPPIQLDLAAEVPSKKAGDLPAELQSLISVHDFEDVARRLYTKKAFAFYSSAATDLLTHSANSRAYQDLMLRPRILRNVKNVSIKRSILGCSSSAPFFVSPAAMAKLAHPDGELAVARGCGEEGIIHIVSAFVFI
jgi:L-lactate dehydrogenase (cytochrome)